MLLKSYIPQSLLRMWVAHYLLVVLLTVHQSSCCEEAIACTLSDGQTGMCHNNTCLSGVVAEQRSGLLFTIIVRYPDTSLQNHGGSKLFLRGNGLGLEWTVGTPLVRTGPDTWKLDITYQSSLAGYKCQNCRNVNVLQDDKLQYRVFIDNSINMLGANFAISFPVSQTSKYFGTKPEFNVYPWFSEKTGSIDSFSVRSDFIKEDRNISIYFPPSFRENNLKTYPALLVFDLSVDFAHFFKRNLEEPIIPFGIAEEYILVGFGDYKKMNAERTEILTQTEGNLFVCFNGTMGNRCDSCIPENINTTETLRYLDGICGLLVPGGGLGDKTLDFLITEVMPVAKSKSSDRIKNNTLGVMGYSLGGLMSCYAAWTRPDVFHMAACQSPSFWWPLKNNTLDEVNFDFINKTLKNPAFASNRPSQRIYLDAGGAEIGDPYRLTQSVVEVADLISTHAHYEMDKNVWVVVDPDKEHSYVEWGKRMGLALSTLLPAPGEPSMPPAQSASFVG